MLAPLGIFRFLGQPKALLGVSEAEVSPPLSLSLRLFSLLNGSLNTLLLRLLGFIGAANKPRPRCVFLGMSLLASLKLPALDRKPRILFVVLVVAATVRAKPRPGVVGQKRVAAPLARQIRHGLALRLRE